VSMEWHEQYADKRQRVSRMPGTYSWSGKDDGTKKVMTGVFDRTDGQDGKTWSAWRGVRRESRLKKGEGKAVPGIRTAAFPAEKLRGRKERMGIESDIKERRD